MNGWTIRIVDHGVRDVIVRSDPGAYDTDRDGLSDAVEYYETFTNATDRDTDSDGLEDFTEAIDGFVWNGSVYFTNASAFDTDNDGLEDGEEVVDGEDQYITHANNADSDADGLNDGGEVLFVPRPRQSQLTRSIMIQMATHSPMVGRCRYSLFNRTPIVTAFGL